MQERQDHVQQQATGQLGQRNSRYKPTTEEFRQKQSSGPGFGETMLRGIAGLAENISKMKFIDETERLYVEGERARFENKSWEDVKRNTLTAPFLRGGFQDQDLRMRMQGLNSEAAAYIKQQGRRQDPESFQKWYRPKADAVLADVGKGLSRETRGAVIKNLMSQEGTLTELHNKEYQQYIYESTGQTISAEVNSMLVQAQEIKALGGDMTPVAERVQQLFEGIWTTEFDLETQEEFITKATEALFEADFTEFASLVDPSSPNFSLQGLRHDSLSKINSAKSAAMERTKFKRTAAAHVRYHELSERQKRGDPVRPDEVHSFISEFGDTEYGTAANLQKVMALLKGTATDNKRLAGAAWIRRDHPGFYGYGRDEQQAANDFGNMQWEDSPNTPGQNMTLAIQGAVDNGTIPDKYISTVSAAIHAVLNSPDGTILPYHAEVLDTWTQHIVDLKDSGSLALAGKMQNMMPADLKGMIPAIENRPVGISVQEALRTAGKYNAEAAKEAATRKGALTRSQLQEYAIEEHRNGRFGDFFKGLGRLTGIAPEVLRNDDIASRMLEHEIVNSMERFSSMPGNEFLTEEHLYRMALADVQQNTIQMNPYNEEISLLVLPSGYMDSLTDIAKQQGVELNQIGSREIRDAAMQIMDTYLQDKPELLKHLQSEGMHVQFIDGRMQARWRSTDKDRPMESEFFPLESDTLAMTIANTRQAAFVHSYAAEAGGVYTVKSVNSPGVTSVPVQIHGQNTVGMNPQQVLDLRQQILDRETFSPVPYADGKNKSMGFGRYFSKGKAMPESITPEEATAWFIEDTNNALVEARKIAAEYGIEGENMILAIAGGVYQQGPEGMRSHTKMLRAMANKHRHDFLYERENSRWYFQTRERVHDFYERALRDFPEKQWR